MILYKYKSCDPIEHVEEIVRDGQFYFANWNELNDPMEGYFSYSREEIDSQSVESIVSGKSGLRICSLSRRYDDPRMWTHYAKGHKGICIGINIDDKVDLVRVSYQRIIPRLRSAGVELSHTPKSILSSKVSLWKHEQEYRAFIRSDSGKEKARLGSINCVIFGLRSHPTFRSRVMEIVSNGTIAYQAHLDFERNLVHRKRIGV